MFENNVDKIIAFIGDKFSHKIFMFLILVNFQT